MIEMRGIRRSFHEGVNHHVVLDGLDLSVRAGEIVVLLGRSGSGKSTLLNLISGIDLPDAGSVTIGGVDVTRLSEHDRTLFRRHHLGFVFQFFNLIPTLSVVENLMLPIELKGEGPGAARDRACRLLADVGLDGREDSYADALSGGEQQRVAIARALAHEPDVILADEPTGNLDRETGLTILDVLDREVRKSGKTMIMATHSREVIGMADRIVTFHDGRLVDVQTNGRH